MSEQQDKRVPLENIIRAKTYGTNGAKVTTVEPITDRAADVTQHQRFDDLNLGEQDTDFTLNRDEWVGIGKRMGWKMPD